jgi:hypothetical protein
MRNLELVSELRSVYSICAYVKVASQMQKITAMINMLNYQSAQYVSGLATTDLNMRQVGL